MALCSGMLRRYLARHGGVPKKPLIAAMPISLREAGNTEYTTQATMAVGQPEHADRRPGEAAAWPSAMPPAP